MQIETARRLRDALGACLELEQFTAGHTHESFIANRGLQLIVQKLLEIVGEALNAAARAGATIPEHIPEFRRIVGIRQRITLAMTLSIARCCGARFGCASDRSLPFSANCSTMLPSSPTPKQPAAHERDASFIMKPLNIRNSRHRGPRP